MSPSKLTQSIESHIVERELSRTIQPSEIRVSNVNPFDHVKAQTEKRRRIFIPFVLAYLWIEEYKAVIPEEHFSSVLQESLNTLNYSLDLRNRLNGRTVDVQLIEIPDSIHFTNVDVGYVTVPYAYNEEKVYTPQFSVLAKVKLMNGDQEEKSYDFTYEGGIEMHRERFQPSQGKFIKSYMKFREENIFWLAEQMCKQLLTLESE